MAMRMCAVGECNNEITDGTGSHGGLPICHRCRGEQYKLKKQGAKEIQVRRDRWSYWESRMSYLHPRVLKMMADADRKVASTKRASR